MGRGKLGSVLAVVAGVQLAGQAVASSLNIPNASFETDTAGTKYKAGGAHPTSWFTDFDYAGELLGGGPSYAVHSAATLPPQAAENGTNYVTFSPGELAVSPETAPTTVTPMKTTMRMNSTGITDTTIASATYIATVAVGLPKAAVISEAGSPSFTVALVDNRKVVASQTLEAGKIAPGTWVDLSTQPYVPSVSGHRLQIRITISGFVEGPGWKHSTQGMVDNARLSYSWIPDAGSWILLTIGLGSVCFGLCRMYFYCVSVP